MMTNKNSILYLLGAGASAEALPTVKSFNDSGGVRHKSLIEELVTFSDVIKTKGNDATYYKLCQEAANFVTPDTFARFLFINRRNSDYSNFKILLSSYFFYRERLHPNGQPCVDKRMLSFLATICLEDKVFPDNVGMLVWNYDNQISIACEKFLFDGATFVKNFRAFPLSTDRTLDKNETKLVYLNGVSGYAYNEMHQRIIGKESTIDHPMKNFITDSAHLDQDSKIVEVVKTFHNPTERLLISFAWEKDSTGTAVAHFVSERVEVARAVARATDILVVVGYSFPFFNRMIDNLIFAEMPNVKKIYFQDPHLDGNYLKGQFSLRNDVIIENVRNVSNYFVPFEL